MRFRIVAGFALVSFFMHAWRKFALGAFGTLVIASWLAPRISNWHSVPSFNMTSPNTIPTIPNTANFQLRCGEAGVIKCVGFDRPEDVSGTWGNTSGIIAGSAASPVLDSNVKASGLSSLKMTIASHSGSDASGSYFANFSDRLDLRFGENSTFFVQWRQRFSPEMFQCFSDAAGGCVQWKQTIIGSGDLPGCTPGNSARGRCFTSCSPLEIVVHTYQIYGFPVMYNSCTGSTSHGPYDLFQTFVPPSDFKLQNARRAPYCLYSQKATNPPSLFPPQGNCYAYGANEWMTFQVQIETGARVNDEFTASHVRLWVARFGKPSELVIDWGPYNLSAGNPPANLKYGKVWLLTHMTNKDSSQSHSTAYTWFDELIISRTKIPDPISED
jgi:hypothetical protein